MESVASRRFFRELASAIGATVKVITTNGRVYVGELIGYDPHSLSLCLGEAEDNEKNRFHRVFIAGNSVSEILRLEKPLNLKKLAEELERIFPRMVKYDEEARVITVMNRIRITEKGVEGEGPLADRARKIFEEFLSRKEG
mgnify:CR=1 FL=1